MRAALAVNQELVLLYSPSGKAEGRRQKVDVTVYTRKGFSRTNLLYMRAFAEAYPDEQIVQQAAGQIPWSHNCVLLARVKVPEQRVWYIRQTSLTLKWWNFSRNSPEK